MKIDEIAQDLVNATSPLVGGRTINIMDKKGIIIASSEKNRIGSFHQGAAEVITRGETVCIYKNNLDRYKGAKEGINMPIINNNKIRGVVGIYGNPDEVIDAAKLLRAYVELYFKQIAIVKKQEVEEKVRTELLKILIYGKNLSEKSISQLSSVIFLHIKMPMLTIVINFQGNKNDKVKSIMKLKKIQSFLLEQQFIKSEQDIYSIVDEQLVILKTFCGLEKTVQKYLKNIFFRIKFNLKIVPTIACGNLCNCFQEISEAYHSASIVANIGKGGIYNLEEHRNMLIYFMQKLEMDSIGEKFIARMYSCLFSYFGEKDIKNVMLTIEKYLEASGSINIASQNLYIHKNTLIYRMNKIYSLLGIKEEELFMKEFLLRLILLYYNNLS
ncbi:hypothetical protein D4Z93_02805 [Clostridium fermenticellae]|uniref:Uncharacterized protein n=1 Tax=Clostridium fermenticellae TaxID=2068654 RepID=A0A386H1D9_9CLOT|nr:sugar diacid recognition domain-containing protein [Clostridium fermenticellae]AYD39527.1 hypothetical protein D4Z93_02805 [Clostridium fermenticellae]